MILRVACFERSIRLCLVALACLILLASALRRDDDENTIAERDTRFATDSQNVFHPPTLPKIELHSASEAPDEAASFNITIAATNALQELHSALETMQDDYFYLWVGKWISAIDWTAAVMGTHVSAALYSLSHSLSYTLPGTFDKQRKLDVEAQMVENQINKYFSQTITYFFGEDHFAIRNQAYDDMLWVVLGWLGSIQFINSHSDLHYPPTSAMSKGDSDWHGRQFIPAFAHRARIFYELAQKGWDWKLCGGGMNWNPHTALPYKNAITNELFISASIEMYLHFPGDDNCSPFMSMMDSESMRHDRKPIRKSFGQDSSLGACANKKPGATYDPIYLSAAVNGYDWLKSSGMTNDKGLYVDGFHITDYGKNHTIGTGKCDERNEMVYTYNQGVLLSGLRGLWEATGEIKYLEDAHELVRNVIRATGWNDRDLSATISLASPSPSPLRDQTKRSLFTHSPPTISNWSGIGSHGILEELCDSRGSCSQNGQTFKGIFMHHLTVFCAPLPLTPASPDHTFAASQVVYKLHKRSCNEYAPWIVHNARAALNTRDKDGRFGTWWGVERFGELMARKQQKGAEDDEPISTIPILPLGAADYRNMPTEADPIEWQTHGPPAHNIDDPNDRGRGRTVETQGTGVAVVRAMWEFLRNYDE